MWSTEASATTEAQPEAVWELWADVGNWKEWDPGVEGSSIDGPFAEGTRYVLKPKGGPKVKAVLTDVRPGEGFSDRTRLPLANLDFSTRRSVSARGRASPTGSRSRGRSRSRSRG
jgi:uncharacterized protein YndB with AHSA1/START domain